MARLLWGSKPLKITQTAVERLSYAGTLAIPYACTSYQHHCNIRVLRELTNIVDLYHSHNITTTEHDL